MQNFIKSYLLINIILVDVAEITVAGYLLVSEKAIISPNILPTPKEEICITLLLVNIRFMSTFPSKTDHYFLQGDPSSAIISFLLKLTIL